MQIFLVVEPVVVSAVLSSNDSVINQVVKIHGYYFNSNCVVEIGSQTGFCNIDYLNSTYITCNTTQGWNAGSIYVSVTIDNGNGVGAYATPELNVGTVTSNASNTVDLDGTLIIEGKGFITDSIMQISIWSGPGTCYVISVNSTTIVCTLSGIKQGPLKANVISNGIYLPLVSSTIATVYIGQPESSPSLNPSPTPSAGPSPNSGNPTPVTSPPRSPTTVSPSPVTSPGSPTAGNPSPVTSPGSPTAGNPSPVTSPGSPTTGNPSPVTSPGSSSTAGCPLIKSVQSNMLRFLFSYLIFVLIL